MILILQPSKKRGEGAYNSATLGELNIVKIPETFLLRLHVSNTMALPTNLTSWCLPFTIPNQMFEGTIMRTLAPQVYK